MRVPELLLNKLFNINNGLILMACVADKAQIEHEGIVPIFVSTLFRSLTLQLFESYRPFWLRRQGTGSSFTASIYWIAAQKVKG